MRSRELRQAACVAVANGGIPLQTLFATVNVERGDEAGWGFCCLDDLELWQLRADRAWVEGGVGCRLFVLLAPSRAVIECGSLSWPDSLCTNTVELSVAVCVEFPCCGWPFDSAG